MVRAVFPTPPSPSTTSLYNTIRPAMMMTATATTTAKGRQERWPERVENRATQKALRVQGGREQEIVQGQRCEIISDAAGCG